MARFTAAVKTSAPETLTGLACGQWIDYDGAKGRWVGRTKGGTVLIAWGRRATDARQFKDFVAVCKAMINPQPYPRRTPPTAPAVPVAVPPSFEAGVIYSPRNCPSLKFFVMSGNAEIVDVWKVCRDLTQQRVGSMPRDAFVRLLGR